MDSGITFRSQELADRQQARGSQYQMQGAEAIGSAIGQAPGRFQQARQQQMDLARSAIENQTAEIQKAQMQEKLMATQQLRGLDMQRLQRDALDISVQHQRLQLDQARRQAEGELEPKDLFHFAMMAHGDFPVFPTSDGGLMGVSVDMSGGHAKPKLVPLSKDQQDAYYQRHGHQAELAKMSNDALIAAMHATLKQYEDFGGGLKEGGPEAVQPFIDELRRRGMGGGTTPQGGQRPDMTKPEGQIPQEAPTYRDAFSGVPDPTTVTETLPSENLQHYQNTLAEKAGEYAKQYNVPLKKAAASLLIHLNNQDHPERMAKVLVQSGLNQDQATIVLKNSLHLTLEQAKQAVQEALQ